MSKKLFLILLLGVIILAFTSNTLASTEPVKKPDNYPTKTIEFIVPAPAGAAIDIPSRVLVEILDLGKPVVIVNRPGASQIIGTTQAANAKPDGYTIVLGANGNFMIQPHLTDLTYGPEDFRHLSMLHTPEPQALVVVPDSPYKTFEDLEVKLKAGEELNYSSGNPGSVGHLASVSLLQQMNAKVEFVPFTGTAEGIAALLGKHIDFYVVDCAEVVPRLGQLLPLVVLSEERNVSLPDVPCAKEFGYADMVFKGYKWIAAHKDTPDDIVNWIKQQIDIAIESEEYQSYLMKSYGRGVKIMTEKEVTDEIFLGYQKFGELLESLGMKK